MVVNGQTLTEKDIQHLRARIKSGQFYTGLGVRHEIDVTDRYVAEVANAIKLKRPLKIIVDAGNGVTGKIAPALYRQMGCEVIELFCEIEGSFPIITRIQANRKICMIYSVPCTSIRQILVLHLMAMAIVWVSSPIAAILSGPIDY